MLRLAADHALLAGNRHVQFCGHLFNGRDVLDSASGHTVISADIGDAEVSTLAIWSSTKPIMLLIHVASVFFASDSGTSPMWPIEVRHFGAIASDMTFHSAPVESRPFCLAMRDWIFVKRTL